MSRETSIRIEIIHQHAQRRFLLSALAGKRAAGRGAYCFVSDVGRCHCNFPGGDFSAGETQSGTSKNERKTAGSNQVCSYFFMSTCQFSSNPIEFDSSRAGVTASTRCPSEDTSKSGAARSSRST